MYIAIIPARGGSKGILNKNLQLVGGVSLVGRAILAAQSNNQIHKVIVSTDSSEIAKEAMNYNAVVHYRSKVSSTDTARTIDVIKEICIDLSLKKEICILLQPTSPLRTAHHISEAIHAYEESGKCGAVATVVEAEHHPYKMVVLVDNGTEHYLPVHSLNDLEAPRQDLPKAFRVNGAIYIKSFKELVMEDTFFSKNQKFLKMSISDSVDIDTYEDLIKANQLIEDGKVYETKF